jgi:hypothetical protein
LYFLEQIVCSKAKAGPSLFYLSKPGKCFYHLPPLFCDTCWFPMPAPIGYLFAAIAAIAPWSVSRDDFNSDVALLTSGVHRGSPFNRHPTCFLHAAPVTIGDQVCRAGAGL